MGCQGLIRPMQMTHKSGNKLVIDLADSKLQLVDRLSGQVSEVEVFVAIL